MNNLRCITLLFIAKPFLCFRRFSTKYIVQWLYFSILFLFPHLIIVDKLTPTILAAADLLTLLYASECLLSINIIIIHNSVSYRCQSIRLVSVRLRNYFAVVIYFPKPRFNPFFKINAS